MIRFPMWNENKKNRIDIGGPAAVSINTENEKNKWHMLSLLMRERNRQEQY